MSVELQDKQVSVAALISVRYDVNVQSIQETLTRDFGTCARAELSQQYWKLHDSNKICSSHYVTSISPNRAKTTQSGAVYYRGN